MITAFAAADAAFFLSQSQRHYFSLHGLSIPSRTMLYQNDTMRAVYGTICSTMSRYHTAFFFFSRCHDIYMDAAIAASCCRRGAFDAFFSLLPPDMLYCRHCFASRAMPFSFTLRHLLPRLFAAATR